MSKKIKKLDTKSIRIDDTATWYPTVMDLKIIKKINELVEAINKQNE